MLIGLNTQKKLPEALSESADVFSVTTQDFEARGVDDRTRYQLRSTTYGTDAAQALARLDHEERAWNQKLDDYAAAKAQA
ncbi:MAG: lipase chaperone, partial [Micavibrio aeruginosavorus]